MRIDRNLIVGIVAVASMTLGSRHQSFFNTSKNYSPIDALLEIDLVNKPFNFVRIHAFVFSLVESANQHAPSVPFEKDARVVLIKSFNGRPGDSK